ncbi:unnamed protein product [Gordionus sp. m RMFG-2023]
MLEKHKYNLHKYIQYHEYFKINKELINSRTTVLQLKFELNELENLRRNILMDDIVSFDNRVKITKENAILSLQSFEEFIKIVSLKNKISDLTKNEILDDNKVISSIPNDTMFLLSQSMTQEVHNYKDILEENNKNLQTLQKDLKEVNQIFIVLSSIVDQSKEKLNSTETKILESNFSTEKGIKNLTQALKYKGTIYPIMGAALGSCIGGPVGFFCGIKIGGIAALSGAIIGIQGGQLIKKIKKNNMEINDNVLSNNIVTSKNNEETTQILKDNDYNWRKYIRLTPKKSKEHHL